MNKKVKYGIAGMGGFGGTRRKTLRDTGCFEIVGGTDLRDDIFVLAEKEEGKPVKRYASVEEMAADPEIEAVFISTPAHLHVEQGLIAAGAGKPIFVEKPLGHDREACVKLVEYCEKNNIPHGHGFSLRFTDLWQYVKKMLNEGTLGKIVSVSAVTMHAGGLAAPPDNWRFLAGRNPGGPIFQCGIHKIDLLRFLFGEGKWLAGYVNRTVTPSPTDDAYVLLGAFGGVPTTFHSHYVASYRHAMEIYGTKGDLFITEYPTKLEYKATDLTAGFEPSYNIIEKVPRLEAELDSLRDFALAVRERRQPIMNGREGLKSLDMVFEAARVATEIR
jgi:UDP-N-acetyl-2-amino-2-deoxyglucuronate dehydrogenase